MKTLQPIIMATFQVATIATICGEPLPEGQGPDSTNRLPVLLNKASQITERPALVTASYAGFLTLREGKWKAVFGTKWTGGFRAEKYGGSPPKGTPKDGPEVGQLYDIAADPYEKNDLWESHPEVVAELSRKLQAIKALDRSDPFPE